MTDDRRERANCAVQAPSVNASCTPPYGPAERISTSLKRHALDMSCVSFPTERPAYSDTVAHKVSK